jgi:transposase
MTERIVTSFSSCPTPESARLGRTLKKWRREFHALLRHRRRLQGGTEATNGLLELHRRIAHDFCNRENYYLLMLLIGGRPLAPPRVRSAY